MILEKNTHSSNVFLQPGNPNVVLINKTHETSQRLKENETDISIWTSPVTTNMGEVDRRSN